MLPKSSKTNSCTGELSSLLATDRVRLYWKACQASPALSPPPVGSQTFLTALCIPIYDSDGQVQPTAFYHLCTKPNYFLCHRFGKGRAPGPTQKSPLIPRTFLRQASLPSHCFPISTPLENPEREFHHLQNRIMTVKFICVVKNRITGHNGWWEWIIW